ncbi:MAG: bifunctional 2-polyprenyl-6-hydroxyphenol methylase/3-demethylubiquinol 3-O-methyltransferase UbiG [Alphaproteobacteria bacterium]
MKLWTTAQNVLQTLRSPPERARVYRDYNRTRQQYILQATTRHFAMRADDPAPLLGKTLLDVGCGKSTIGEFLALSGAEITAVDPRAEALAEAQASAEEYGAPVTFIQSRAEDMLNSLGRYDVILALDVLEETPDASKMMWVLKQLLNPGGVLIFSVITRTPKAWFIHKLLSQYVYGRGKNIRVYKQFYTPLQLEALAAKQDLTMSDVQGLGFSLSTQKWRLKPYVDTRYMAIAVLK